MTQVIEAWKLEGEYVVGQKTGTRIRRERFESVCRAETRLLRPDEIAPGVDRFGRDELELIPRNYADGVYEHKVARFKQLGESAGPASSVKGGVGAERRTSPSVALAELIVRKLEGWIVRKREDGTT